MTAPSASYGEPAKRGVVGPIIAVGAVLLVIALVIVAFQYFQKINSVTVSATTAGYELIDDHTLRVNVDVSRNDPEAKAYCIITSMNYDKAEVGRREFVVESGGAKVQRFQVDIPSRDIPVAGKVYGCSDKLPAHLAG